jgi:hypothetical protein
MDLKDENHQAGNFRRLLGGRYWLDFLEKSPKNSILEKYFARLGSLSGADKAAGFKDIHHPRRPGVSETQAPLQQ